MKLLLRIVILLKEFFKKFFKNSYAKGLIITSLGGVMGGIVLFFILKNLEKTSFKNGDMEINEFAKPIVKMEPYRIKVTNTTLPDLDTLEIDFIYDGSPILIQDDFKIADYNIDDKRYFATDYVNPELKLIEAFINNPILDSLNPRLSVQIQLARYSIFEAREAAWFREEDKRNIGYVNISYSYTINEDDITDSIRTRIYLEKMD